MAKKAGVKAVAVEELQELRTALVEHGNTAGLVDTANRYLTRVRDHAGADEL